MDLPWCGCDECDLRLVGPALSLLVVAHGRGPAHGHAAKVLKEAYSTRYKAATAYSRHSIGSLTSCWAPFFSSTLPIASLSDMNHMPGHMAHHPPAFPTMVTINASAIQPTHSPLSAFPVTPGLAHPPHPAMPPSMPHYQGPPKQTTQAPLPPPPTSRKKKGGRSRDPPPNVGNAYVEYMGTGDIKLENFQVQDQCQYCKYYTDKKDRMRRHIRTQHLEEKPYVCSVCQYSANRKDKVQRHINCVHSLTKRFKCEYCSHSSNRKDKIKLHVDSVHLKIPRPKKSKSKKNAVAAPNLANSSSVGSLQKNVSVTNEQAAAAVAAAAAVVSSPYFPLMGGEHFMASNSPPP